MAFGPSMDRDQHIRRRLKLRHFEILIAVANAQSMAKAATHLAISQSAISRAIADLERTLGVALFERSPQGVEPTHFGHALIRRGIAAFDEIAQGVKDIVSLADPTQGELWIGSTPGLSEGGVLAGINRLSRLYPRVIFHVVPCGLPQLYQQLRDRRVELGYADIPGNAPHEDFETEVLFDDTLAVVSAASSPWARRRKIGLSELVNEPWTWPEAGTLLDSLMIAAFRASALQPPRATVYADAINLRTRLAATGRFLAVVPASTMHFSAYSARLKVLPVQLPATRREIGIIRLRRRAMGPLAQRFVECLRKLAKTHG
jgi:DNA-binding transcriptional LysR family regulator